MLCPICRTGTMSETRPYVWSCSLCGNTEFRPREDSSYASSYDTSSYDTSSSYTSSYDTSSSYGAKDYSYSGTSSSVNSHISANRQSRYGDVNNIRDVNDALRYLENIRKDAEKNYRDLSRSSKKQGKGGVSFWGIAVVAFIVWVLLLELMGI